MSILNAQLIVELRLANGLSPIALAKELGVSPVAIRSLEQGKKPCQPHPAPRQTAGGRAWSAAGRPYRQGRGQRRPRTRR